MPSINDVLMRGFSSSTKSFSVEKTLSVTIVDTGVAKMLTEIP